MILKLKDFKENCKMILDAVDSNVSSVVSEVLEIEAKEDKLYMSVTNGEYYVTVAHTLDSITDNMRAVVPATLFLNLVSNITTDDIEFNISDNILVVKGNGVYKIPLIFNESKLMELPKIEVKNETNKFNIPTVNLQSVLKYNSKEFLKNVVKSGISKLYYLDEKGCVTKTSGACINDFSLENPVKLVLNEKLVKLFKLFKDENVEFSIGHESYNDMIKTTVKFYSSNVIITSIVSSDEALINKLKINVIRGLANTDYAYNVVIDKNILISSVARLSLFAKKELATDYTKFVFSNDGVRVFDFNEEGHEDIAYANGSSNIDSYSCIIGTDDLKLILASCDEQFINIKFGNHQAIVIERGNIRNILPECEVK